METLIEITLWGWTILFALGLALWTLFGLIRGISRLNDSSNRDEGENDSGPPA